MAKLFEQTDRDKIKARALQLVETEGISQGEAAQRAISELFTPQQITAAYEKVSPTVTAEVAETQRKIDEEEQRYLRERKRQLEAGGGFTEQEAESTAKKELEQSVRTAAPLGFGGVEDRKEGFVSGAAGLGREEPIAEQQAAAPSGIDYERLQNLFEEELNLSPEQASSQVSAFRDFILEPTLTNIKEKEGLSGAELDRQAVEQSFAILAGIDKKLKDKSTYLQPEQAPGSSDPWIRAFSKQIQLGEGVPNLTEAERSYLNATVEAGVDEQVKARKGETKVVVVLKDGTEIDAASYDPQFDGPATTKKVVKTDEEIRAEINKKEPMPWWLTEDAEKIKKNPEDYEKFGIFTKTTPYGTQKETSASWLLRSAMSPFNAAAGQVADIGYGLDADLETKREEARPKGFKDSPVLLNVAEGRGFFGEASEMTELLNMEGGAKYATMAGGFALDLVDPSFDLAKGVTTGIKGATQNIRAANRIYGTSKGSGALKEAYKLGKADFLDNYILTSFTNKNFAPGDFRNLMSKQVTRDLEAHSKMIEQSLDIMDSPTARQAYDNLSETAKNSHYGKKLKSVLDDLPADAAIDDALAKMDDLFKTKDKMLDEVARITEELDDIINDPSKSFKNLRRKDVARSLGAAARADEGVKAAIGKVFAETKPSGATKLTTAISELAENPVAYDVFKKHLLSDLASKRIAKATKGISAFDQNLVFVTRNILTDKKTAKEIIDRLKKSELGVLSSKLAEGEVVTTVARKTSITDPTSPLPARVAEQRGRTAARVLPAYKLDAEDVDKIFDILEELDQFGKIDPVTNGLIRTGLEQGVITTINFRTLLDANADLIAEGLHSTKITRSRDLARLPIGEQVEFLMPMEQRTFARSAAKKIYEKLTGRTPKLGNLSIGQRQLINKVRTKIANVDKQLRREIKLLSDNKEFRAAYGIPENETLLMPEIISALIVGPRDGASRAFIEEQINGILFDLFYTKSTKENIFDLFTGTSVSKNVDVFSQKGKDQLQELIDEAVFAAIDDPTKLLFSLEKVLDEAGKMVASGDQTLLRFPPDEIKSVLKESNGKIPAEVQVGSYYRAEANRIADEALGELINSEIGKGRLSVFDELPREVQQEVAKTLNKAAYPKQIWESTPMLRFRIGNDVQLRFIKNRMKRILSGEKGVVSEDDVSEVLQFATKGQGKQASLFPHYLTKKLGDPNFRYVFELMSEAAEDVAQGIIRRNNLQKTDEGILQAEKLIGSLGQDTGKDYGQLKLLFGEDVASQLRSELLSGFEDIRGQILELLEAKYTGTLTEQGAARLKEGFEALQNLRYTLILNARPRFHGANLMTGADIVYSTTGKLPRLDDIAEAMVVIANKDPNKIIKVGGRNFTVGELNEIVGADVGQTVYRAALPSAEQGRIIKMIEEGNITGKPVKDFLMDLPQTEDSLYRYAVLKAALREGRSMDEAIALARRSMFDASDTLDIEKGFKKLALFYGFQRNNLVNAVKNLTSLKGMKRLRNVGRFRQNLSDAFTDEETRKYSPSYAQSRIIFNKIGFDPDKGKSLITTSPPLASLDALYGLADVLKGEPQGLLGGAIRSEYKALLGVEDKFAIDPEEVPSEHIAILGMGGSDPLDSINLLLAGFGASPTTYVPTDEPFKGREIEGKKGRYTIPLTTPKQRRAYKLFMTAMAWSGMASPITDYSRALSPQGTKVEPLGARGQLMFGTAAETPLTFMSPEKQAYYDRVSRLRQLQSLTRELKKDEDARIEETLVPEEKGEEAFRPAKPSVTTKPEMRSYEQIGDELIRAERAVYRADNETDFNIAMKRFDRLKEELDRAYEREQQRERLK